MTQVTCAAETSKGMRCKRPRDGEGTKFCMQHHRMHFRGTRLDPCEPEDYRPPFLCNKHMNRGTRNDKS